MRPRFAAAPEAQAVILASCASPPSGDIENVAIRGDCINAASAEELVAQSSPRTCSTGQIVMPESHPAPMWRNLKMAGLKVEYRGDDPTWLHEEDCLRVDETVDVPGFCEGLPSDGLLADRAVDVGRGEADDHHFRIITPAQAMLNQHMAEMHANAITVVLIRRHVLSTLYVETTSRFFIAPDDQVYAAFRARYDELMNLVEAQVVPPMEPAAAV